jgi:hypothetical protein
MFKTMFTAAALTFVLAGGAQAGCLTGAAAGAVVGHMAGHHGVAGAAVGCAVGHHRAKEKQAAKQPEPGQTPQ